MDNFRFQDLTSKPFLIGDLLRQEGLRLRDCRPLKDTPKQPSGSKSRLSEMSRTGEGPAHCIVRKWPADKTPVQWGMRNPFLLSDVVSPGIWEQLGGNYVAVKHDIAYSGLLDVRMNDNGNEEAYRLLIAKLLSRVTAAAFMFFLNAWSRHPTHQDFLPAIECLRRFDIKQETTSESSPIAIRGDVVSHIPRQLPLPKQNELEGASQTVALLFVNAKSTAHAEFHYQPIHLTNDFSSIRTVDQVMDFCLLESESRPQKLSVANLDSFLFENSIHVWPHIAAGHFSQMAYKSLVSTSSLGAFSALWGFHRVCFLEHVPDGTNILYVSDNVAADTSDESSATAEGSNLRIVHEFYFLTILSIIHTWGVRIIPPHLKDEENFLSYFHGG